MSKLKSGLKQHFYFKVENAISLKREGLIITGQEAEELEIISLISPNMGGLTHQQEFLIKFNDRKLIINKEIKNDLETIKASIKKARK